MNGSKAKKLKLQARHSVKNSKVLGRDKYECVKCHTRWEQDEGIAVPCPKCGSMYAKWRNYEQLRKDATKRKAPAFGY